MAFPFFGWARFVAPGWDVCGRDARAPGRHQCGRGRSVDGMSIQKESDGMPEVNPRRRTTKVNFGIILSVLIFFAVTIGVAVWVANSPESPEGTPAGPTINR